MGAYQVQLPSEGIRSLTGTVRVAESHDLLSAALKQLLPLMKERREAWNQNQGQGDFRERVAPKESDLISALSHGFAATFEEGYDKPLLARSLILDTLEELGEMRGEPVMLSNEQLERFRPALIEDGFPVNTKAVRQKALKLFERHGNTPPEKAA